MASIFEKFCKENNKASDYLRTTSIVCMDLSYAVWHQYEEEQEQKKYLRDREEDARNSDRYGPDRYRVDRYITRNGVRYRDDREYRDGRCVESSREKTVVEVHLDCEVTDVQAEPNFVQAHLAARRNLRMIQLVLRSEEMQSRTGLLSECESNVKIHLIQSYLWRYEFICNGYIQKKLTDVDVTKQLHALNQEYEQQEK